MGLSIKSNYSQKLGLKKFSNFLNSKMSIVGIIDTLIYTHKEDNKITINYPLDFKIDRAYDTEQKIMAYYNNDNRIYEALFFNGEEIYACYKEEDKAYYRLDRESSIDIHELTPQDIAGLRTSGKDVVIVSGGNLHYIQPEEVIALSVAYLIPASVIDSKRIPTLEQSVSVAESIITLMDGYFVGNYDLDYENANEVSYKATRNIFSVQMCDTILAIKEFAEKEKPRFKKTIYCKSDKEKPSTEKDDRVYKSITFEEFVIGEFEIKENVIVTGLDKIKGRKDEPLLFITDLIVEDGKTNLYVKSKTPIDSMYYAEEVLSTLYGFSVDSVVEEGE